MYTHFKMHMDKITLKLYNTHDEKKIYRKTNII